MLHMSWSPLETANPLPATGVKDFASAYYNDSFIATVCNLTTGKNDYYSLDPSNLSAGWQKEGPSFCPPYKNHYYSVYDTLHFAFGSNSFDDDWIDLPDNEYLLSNWSWPYPPLISIDLAIREIIFTKEGNAITYINSGDAENYYHNAGAVRSRHGVSTDGFKGISSYAGYYTHVWPYSHDWPDDNSTDSNGDFIFDSMGDLCETFDHKIDPKDPQIPSFFYSFTGHQLTTCFPLWKAQTFYIAFALEAKSNQYHSLVTSYSYSLPTEIFLVADPIAPAGEVIMGCAGSNKGYVAVGSDGATYFARP